ncbi:alpha/beta fold hydrolase [Hydrogenophaga sp.]|uniref:alpha/beta fold hydrolase n=1 Tax=Hydrogenophaga sp. TaxID=1904254 RepID=UPI0027226B64|nr:alpha/beta fold hydrolase [Hydrogenophaga sp.]MDO9435188.1 alpha/beta fold hydrolase [Hydrogenophaga sp.]
MSVESTLEGLRWLAWGDGAQLEVRDEGHGAPLLLLHGVGGCADAWDIQRPLLATGRRLIAWNAPGYAGSSVFAAENPVLDDYAAAVMSVLDALELDQVDVLGHSMGGLIAARFAALAPERVRRLLLADCSSGHRGYDVHQRSQILATRLTQDASDPWVYARARAPKLLSTAATPSQVEEASAMLARLRQPGFGQAARMVSSSDLFEFASEIKASTLVICGSEDGITSPALNQQIADAIPGALYASIDGAGHWSFLERPVQFAQLVHQHLA